MEEAFAPRERRVVWTDTRVYEPWIRERPGLEFVQALADGSLPNPPMFELLGFRLTQVEKGRVAATGEAGEHLYNPAGVVHGGFVATIIDATTALAVRTHLPPASRMTSIEVKVHFVRAILDSTGTVTGVGTVVHLGRKVSIAEGKVFGSDGKLLAYGTASIAVLQ